jgi:hypothetical protein
MCFRSSIVILSIHSFVQNCNQNPNVVHKKSACNASRMRPQQLLLHVYVNLLLPEFPLQLPLSSFCALCFWVLFCTLHLRCAGLVGIQLQCLLLPGIALQFRCGSLLLVLLLLLFVPWSLLSLVYAHPPCCIAAHSECLWCPRPDSNWHSVNRRRILSPLCLPIPPRGLIGLP